MRLEITDQRVGRRHDLVGSRRDAEARELGRVGGRGVQRLIAEERHARAVGADSFERFGGAGQEVVAEIERPIPPARQQIDVKGHSSPPLSFQGTTQA